MEKQENMNSIRRWKFMDKILSRNDNGKDKQPEVNSSLAESEEKYRQIVDNSLEGIYIIQERKIRFCNKQFAQMFGFSNPEEAVGKDIGQLISPNSLERVELELYSRETGEKEISHYTFTANTVDGKEFEVETLGCRIHYNGKIAVQGAMRDISRQKQLEAQLRQAQKMEAIGTLAGGISHDFNNILSVIIGYTEISLNNMSDAKKLRHNMKHVLKAANRAKDLVHQILSFSRMGETEKGPVKVVPVIKEALKLIRASLPSTIEIRQDIARSDYRILADPTQLHQVMMNLCTNAAHAMMESGGILKVEVSDLNIDLNGQPDSNSSPSPYMRLTVRDSGYGMDKELMERIFDPFFTTKDLGEGTGLGLSVVHGIVTGLDGEISVESEPGKGTAFHVFVPLILNEPQVSVQTAPKAKIPRGGERILLVDDEETLVHMSSRMLQQLGYQVTAMVSSPDALEQFRQTPDDFDLVITDLTMPEMTGIHLTTELIKIRSDIPIILCTGYSKELDPDELHDLGIKKMVLKPYSRMKFASTIREVLD